MTASTALRAAIANGIHGVSRPGNEEFAILRNYALGVDGGDTGAPGASATKMFADSRSVAASANDNLDMSGSLTAADGTTFSPSLVYGIVVRNTAAAGGGVLTIGAAAANQFDGPFSAVTGAVKLEPGESVAFESVAGWAVVGGTGDILGVSNSAAGAATYDIVVIGA
jgi:hypothetical protein